MSQRLIHIEYETEDTKKNVGVAMLSIRDDDLKSISFSTECGAWVSFTREDVVNALTCYQRTKSIKERANEACEHLKQMKKEREASKITELEHRIDEHTEFNTHHHLDFLALKERVKSLEEQHREILPDPEKFICIDLGYPFKKIYIAKPENPK